MPQTKRAFTEISGVGNEFIFILLGMCSVMVDKNTSRPYAQIYVDSLRRAIIDLTPLESDVLDFLVSRADEYGLCFPGTKDIVVGVDSRAEDVQDAIISLAYKKYVYFVRKDEHDSITRRQLPNVYQISLDYIAINPDAYQKALEIYQDALQRTLCLLYDSKNERRFGIITTDRNNHQNPPSGNHLQEAPTEGPPAKHHEAFKKAADAAGTADAVESPEMPEKPTEGQNAAAQQSSESKDSGSAGRWPKTPPVESYAAPLQPSLESLAQRVYDMVLEIHGEQDTSLTAARCLAYNYESHVENAMKRLFKTRERNPAYEIKSAMGLLTTWARAGYERANRQTEKEARWMQEDDGSRFTNGEYASFINH
jgi:hypothetical protein